MGRLIQQKHPIEVAAAFCEVAQRFPDTTLTVVGSGELASAIARVGSGLCSSLRLCGRLEGSKLIDVLDACDVLVLPAEREVWGLVVNEALSRGLYVIASDEVGAAADLIDDRSGSIIPARDTEALRAAMHRCAASIDQIRADIDYRVSLTRRCTASAFADDVLAAMSIAQGTVK